MTASLLVSTGAMALDHSYGDYAALLGRHVHWIAGGHASSVDYAALKRDGTALEQVLAAFSAVTPGQFDTWERSRQMAFLINAYNAFTLQLVLSGYPDLKSIRELVPAALALEAAVFRPAGRAAEPDWIEHDRLRPVYADPRVHFAVNCASVGCPALRPEPYAAAQLDQQLNDQQRRFLTDRTRNRFSAGDGTLHVSQIFKWFAEDFTTAAGGGLKQWLAGHAALLTDNAADRERVERGDFRLDHLSYDWSLNGRDNQR
ncbi:MAG: DUF547 domain-containing protein [Gammaproteobacteria bacterium]|nr:DUF547 domain-containing protein [Gammaproteobacteria bacterium]